MVCQKLLKEGTCPDGDSCPYSHFVKICDLCNVTLITEFSFNAHLHSREHSRRFYYATNASAGHCVLCAVSFGPPHNVRTFQAHCQTETHRRHAQRVGLNYLADQAHARQVLPHQRLCATCNTPIDNFLWARHIETRRHRNAANTHTARGTLENVSANKHSVEVSGDEQQGYDFGTVDPSPNGNLRSLTVDVELTAPGRVSLVDVRLLSQTGGQRFRNPSPFTLPTFRGPLVHGRSRPLNLQFSPSELGRFEDRVEFVFRDSVLSEQFSIARYVRAVVANAAELAALGPVAPFRRPPRRTFVDRGTDIEGIRYPFPSDIEWVAKLGKYLIPESLQRAIAVGSFEEQLQTVKTRFLPNEMTPTTYTRHWTTLLHLEELKMTTDLAAYDMEGEELEKVPNSHFYKLEVPGLAEKRPSVILGDKIRVRHHGRVEGQFYAGYVHRVEQQHVLLRFTHAFTAVGGQKFDVRFTLTRTSLRRMHQGLSVAWNPTRILFPTADDLGDAQGPTQDEIDAVRLVNRRLEDNFPQKLAVTSILCQKPGSVPFVIFGPPGTGKTVVAVESMRQILMNDPKARILACAPSNSAADLLAERLLQQGCPPSEIFRLNAPTRLIGTLLPTLRTISRTLGDNFVVPPIHELLKFRVIVCTCISASYPYAMGAPRGHFTHIFIDEAGQALEPEAMISIRTIAGPKTNIVLSGDPQQLGPIVRSSLGIKCGLGLSYLDRLMALPIYDTDAWRGISVVKLVQNYRSHESILEYPNRTFYRDELQACADPMITDSLTRFDRLVTPGFPIIFHAISGEDMREASSPSFFNPHEVLVVKDYVQSLRQDQRLRIQDSDIGIISPYNAQNGKLRKSVNAPALKKSRPGTLKVGSVEEFQGQERRVIIVSTVRSNKDYVQYDLRHTLGFVANPRRFNVAMTRAQALLIIVGDPVVLSLDRMWREFLDYIHAQGGWRGAPKDWDDEASAQAHDFVEQRRNDARNSMDELARRLESIVINEGGENGEGDDGDDNGQDRPWREEE